MAFIGYFDGDDFIINYDAPLYDCRRHIGEFKEQDERNEIWM